MRVLWDGIGIDVSNHKCMTWPKRIAQETKHIKFMIPIGVKDNDKIIIKHVSNINIGHNT